MSAAQELELGDTRVEFMCDYVLKTMRIKGDKWMKMYNLDENKQMFMEFFEKPELHNFVINQQPGGSLIVTFEWPAQLKGKACYFVKKERGPVTKETNLRSALIYGDLSYSPIDQLSAFVDEVRFCIFGSMK